MIQQQTYLNVADNSGARKLMCLRVLGTGNCRYGAIGDQIVAVVKDAIPNMPVKRSDVVNSVNIGNETMVYWSDHKVDLDIMANYLNYVRKRVRVPVTTADDLGFWNKEESKKIAEQCDFIVVHIHPLWGGQSIEKSLD